MFPPLIDRAGDGSDDGLVATWPWADQPVISPARRIAAIRRLLGRDPGEPGDVGEPEPVAPGQRMPGGQYEHPRLRLDRLKAESGGGDRRAHECDVSAAVEQSGRGVSQIEGAQPDLDLGICATERGEQGGRRFAGRGDIQPDGQLAVDRPGCVPRRGDTAIESGQRVTSAFQEGAARGGDRDAAARPFQQPGADSVFELPDLGAENLLCDVHSLRGCGKTRFLGNGDEVPQVPQLDVHRGRCYRRADGRRRPTNAEGCHG